MFQVQANGLLAGQGAVGDGERGPIKACCESRFEDASSVFERGCASWMSGRRGDQSDRGSDDRNSALAGDMYLQREPGLETSAGI